MESIDQAFKGWHPGEQAVQELMGLPQRVAVTAIVNKLPEQHRIFYHTRLHYVPVTTLDSEGRPWASLLCSAKGTPGFIESPTETSLCIHAKVWRGDPICNNLRGIDSDASLWDAKNGPFVSGLGLEPSTCRRNKFGGHVARAEFHGCDLKLDLSVSQALGLCPKYINVRDLEPYPDVSPRIVYERLHLQEGDQLPDDVVRFIHHSDTAYLATLYISKPADADIHPSRVGTNHRGGRPGFVRVRPVDGRTLVLPNYNGNRMMNSLGNIYITPLAGMVFPSFSTGSVLFVTGTAETLFGEAARRLMPRVNAITTIYVTGFSFVENALPLREVPDTVEPSPYCPPISYLSEEPPKDSYDDLSLTLVSTRVHNDTLATFTFEAPHPVEVHASQNGVLDLSHFVRERARELVDWNPGVWAQSDDCVRTWTVSIPPTPASPTTLSLTIRLITGGLVTPILHKFAQSVDPKREGKSVDVSSLGIPAKLRGVGGNLPVPEPVAACDGGRRLLWIAGGIGLTPFLSLTRHVVSLAKRAYGVWDVVLVISTREPEVMLTLISDAFDWPDDHSPADLTFAIHIFTDYQLPESLPPLPDCVSVSPHRGRIDGDGTFFGSVDARYREPHLCGPLPFVTNAVKSLGAAGVDPESVQRERFTY